MKEVTKRSELPKAEAGIPVTPGVQDKAFTPQISAASLSASAGTAKPSD